MFRFISFVIVCSSSAASWAAGPDVCAIVPVTAVAAIVHQSMTESRPDVSEDAHAYGCSYGAAAPHTSISVIKPGGTAAFEATKRRLSKAVAVAGIGDKAVFDAGSGLIVLFGDAAVSAYVSPAAGSSEQRLAMEKQLAMAAKSRL